MAEKEMNDSVLGIMSDAGKYMTNSILEVLQNFLYMDGAHGQQQVQASEDVKPTQQSDRDITCSNT